MSTFNNCTITNYFAEAPKRKLSEVELDAELPPPKRAGNIIEERQIDRILRSCATTMLGSMVESSKRRNHPRPDFVDNLDLLNHMKNFLSNIRLDPEDETVVSASCDSYKTSGFLFALRIGSGGALDIGPERTNEDVHYTHENVVPIPRFMNAGNDAQFNPTTFVTALNKAQLPHFTDVGWLKNYLREILDGPKGTPDAKYHPSAFLSKVFNNIKHSSIERNMGDIDITRLQLLELLCNAGFRAKKMKVCVLMTQQVGISRQLQFSPDRPDEFKTYTMENVEIEALVANCSKNGKRGCDRVPDNYIEESYTGKYVNFDAISFAASCDIAICKAAFVSLMETYVHPMEIRVQKIINEIDRTGKMITWKYALDGATNFGTSFRSNLDIYQEERRMVVARSEIARKFFDKTADDELVGELVKVIAHAGKMLPCNFTLKGVPKSFIRVFRGGPVHYVQIRHKVMKRSKIAMAFFAAKPNFEAAVNAVKLEMAAELIIE